MAAAESMLVLSKELEINVRNTYLVVNRVVGEMTPAIRAKVEAMGVPLLAAVPYDPLLVAYDGQGRPLVELPEDAAVSVAVAGIAEKLMGNGAEGRR
jgi:CO dehydrogenase nickel-insertion accessory protein CooC1